MRRPCRVLLVISALLGACDGAVNSAYPGEPIATLTGQLSVKQGLSIDHEVRLSVAWFPTVDPSDPVAPKSIVTEELSYTGTFPQAFRFRFYAPPAAEALATGVDPNDPAVGRAALGQLFAYEDMDDDGKLTLDPAGHARDRILGSSAGAGAFDFLTVADRYLVLWVEGGATLSLPGVRPGYNLIHYTQPFELPEALPLDSRIPLELDADPRLALLACPEAYLDPKPEFACGVRLWNTPVIGASVNLRDDGGLDALVTVGGGDPLVPGTTVKINGMTLPHEGDAATWTLSEDKPGVLHTGVNQLEVSQPGFDPVVLRAVVPARFEVQAPLSGATVRAGDFLDVDWGEATGATIYIAGITLGAGMGTSSDPAPETRARLLVPDVPGEALLNIVAYDRISLERAAFFGVSTRYVPLQVTR